MILPVIGGLGFLGGRLFGRHVGATTAITAGIRNVFAFVLDSHVSNEKGKGDAMQLNNEQGRRVHKSFVRNGDGGFQKAIFGGKEDKQLLADPGRCAKICFVDDVPVMCVLVLLMTLFLLFSYICNLKICVYMHEDNR